MSKEWDLDQAAKPLIAKIVAGTATEADQLALDANTHTRSVLMRPLPPSAELIRMTRRLLNSHY